MTIVYRPTCIRWRYRPIEFNANVLVTGPRRRAIRAVCYARPKGICMPVRPRRFLTLSDAMHYKRSVS